MSKAEERIRELGYELLPTPKPAASYVPTVRVGNMVYVSGQGATKEGKPLMLRRKSAPSTPFPHCAEKLGIWIR